MVMKSARFQSLWHTLTRVYHGIGERSAYIYAQGKIWVAERQLGEATRHAGHRMVASWQAMSWQTLPLQLKVLLVGVGALILLLAIWKIPQWQAASWEGRMEPKDLAQLENNARTTLVQAVGGLALLIGLLFTWRNVRATEQTSQETLRISQEEQLTERFTRAIDQLGSDKLQICLGGIYALERIARDSERDHWPIMEVLTAYVRETAPWPPKPPKDAQPSKGDQSPQEEPPTTQEQRPRRSAADIQAILTVLGRRTQTYGNGEKQRLNLAKTDLQGADLGEARLERADLREANLEGANLWEARLERADLRGAHLEGADLRKAHLEETLIGTAYLEGADLWGAQLEGADIRNAHLERADLRGTSLKGVNLRGTDLRGALLQGADLGEANLEGANLCGAQLGDARLRDARLEGAIGLTVEQLGTVRTLDQARLDPLLLEEVTQKYPHLL